MRLVFRLWRRDVAAAPDRLRHVEGEPWRFDHGRDRWALLDERDRWP